MISCVFSLQSYIYKEESIMGGILLNLTTETCTIHKEKVEPTRRAQCFSPFIHQFGGKKYVGNVIDTCIEFILKSTLWYYLHGATYCTVIVKLKTSE